MTRQTDGWLRTVVVAVVGAMLVVSLGAPVAAVTSASDADVTFVESDVTTDTTWTPGDGPYRIIQDTEVAPGATLTVEPGTRVELAQDITVTVSGSLRTDGTAARPVTITQPDGVAADRRWDSIEYTGTAGSSLTFHNTTLEGGTTGLEVASSAGTVDVVDSTVRDFTTAGLAVTATTAAPPITVRRSTFREVGTHAIQATPSAGTTDRVSLTAASDARRADTDHTLELHPGVVASMDSIRLQYGSDGSVASVGSGSIERIGVDRDGDGTVEQSFAGSVASVSSSDSRLEISFSETVEVPSDGQLIVEYDDAVNPTTRGIYPVEVQLRDGTVSQLAAGVEAAFVVGGVTSPVDADISPEQPSTQVRGLAVLGSTFSEVGGAGVFVAADRVRRIQVSRNRIDGAEIPGSGVVVRAKDTESFFLNNEITGTDDGIRVTTRDRTSVTATRNRIQNTRTGIRVRQSGEESFRAADITLRENTLTNNRLDGISIRTRSLDVTPELTNNTVRANGRDGIHVSGWRLLGGDVSDNDAGDNGGDGIEVDGTLIRGITFSGNDVVGNGDTGVSIRTDSVARSLDLSNNTVADSGGHGIDVRSDLVVYGSDVTDNRLTNNAGAGLVVSSPVTHRANLSVAKNVVAANSYGVVLRGVLDTTVRDNDIVFNTNRFADPVQLPDVEPGTGSYVAEGSGGVIVNRRDSGTPLSALIANPDTDDRFRTLSLSSGAVAILRTDGPSDIRPAEPSGLAIRRASDDLPTGVSISKNGSTNSSYRVTDNGIYGQDRGLTVDVAPLVTTNTTALVVIDPIRTVHAGSNYWGSQYGPYHSSILPEGEGNAVVTKQGWVDFVPFTGTPPDPEYARPTAVIGAPETPQPGEEIRLSGRDSTSAQGPIVRYRYEIDGTTQPITDRPTYSFGMSDGTVAARLTVEDAVGIESDTTAVTIEPGTASPSPTPTPQTETQTPVTTAATPPSTPTSTSTPTPTDSDPTLFASLSSIPGIAGAICYLLALIFGFYGITLTVADRTPPVEGARIQGLAALGIVIWVVAGVIGGGPLLTLGIIAAVVWSLLTGAAYVVVTRGVLDDVFG